MKYTISPATWAFLHALACLAAAVSAVYLGAAAPLAATGIVSFAVLAFTQRRKWTPSGKWGVANTVTLARFGLILNLFLAGHLDQGGYFVVAAGIAVLVADGWDGWLARRRREASEFGEYFDKEADAFFVLVLCLLAYRQNRVEVWILIPGILRYVFVLALFILQPNLGKEYRSRWARVIYVCMVSALLSVFVLPDFLYSPLIILATIALILSFAHYFKWLITESFFFRPPGTGMTFILALGAFLLLNSLLLLPSFLTNTSASTFFPIPDPSRPTTTLSWTRGWYDYVLYFFIRRPNQDLFRICSDLILMVTALILFRANRRLPGILSFLFAIFFIYEIYDAAAFSFFHRRGMLYEDARYVINLYYLLIDAISLPHASRMIGYTTLAILFAWSLPPLFRLIARGFSTMRLRKPVIAFSAVFWPCVVGAWIWFGPADERTTVRSTTGKIAANAIDSFRLARTLSEIERLPIDSVYYSYDDRVLQRCPNIYLFMIESYGRILRDNEYLRERYDAWMQETERLFGEAGWQSVSRYSDAPVTGGLSWLSMNTVLSGISMANKTFYTRYMGLIGRYPHLIHFLKRQGYRTIALQPPNRARPGLPVVNYYDFDTAIYFDDLGYTGPAYSIWVIPDQYSLGYAHELAIRQAPRPYFVFFETVTTHAPWSNLPPYVDDWRTLVAQPLDSAASSASMPITQRLQESFKNRFYKESPDATQLYWESIAYDLRLLRDYVLNEAPKNSLFIVLGDHQPPLLPSANYQTPIHVISRDTTLIRNLGALDFEPGMIPSSRTSSELTHAGIYSLLIDVLTRPEDAPNELPSDLYRPNGIAPSILTLN